jgi:hypothetical protein
MSAELERLIIASAIRQPRLAKRAIGVLKPTHFGSDQRGWLWSLLAECINNGDAGIDRSLLVVEARAKYPDDQEMVTVLMEYDDIVSMEPQAPATMLQKITEFAHTSDVMAAMDRASEARAAGDFARATAILASLPQLPPSGYEASIVRWSEEMDDRNAERAKAAADPDASPRFTTPMHLLNNAFSGGISAGLGSVNAVTNRGKSIMMVNIAKWAMDCGWGVLLFPTEMHASRVAARADSLMTGTPYSQLVSWKLNQIEQRALADEVRRCRARYAGLMRIVSMPLLSATIPLLEQHIADMRGELTPVINGHDKQWVVLLDSAQQIVPPNPRDEMRHKQAAIAMWCKDVSERYGIPLITSLQLNKTAARGRGTAEDVSESYDWSRLADWSIAINATEGRPIATPKHDIPEGEEDEDPAEAASGLELEITKNRDGEKHVRIPLFTDLARMYITEQAHTQNEPGSHRPL